MNWYDCEHEWESNIDSSSIHDEVTCVKCGCPGERYDDEVYWPTT